MGNMENDMTLAKLFGRPAANLQAPGLRADPPFTPATAKEKPVTETPPPVDEAVAAARTVETEQTAAKVTRRKKKIELPDGVIAQTSDPAVAAEAEAAAELPPEKPRFDPVPGIFDIDDETYHGSAGLSKSKLWGLYSATPYHGRFSVIKETNHMKLGKASHAAILQPDIFEAKYRDCGGANKNSKLWKDAIALAEADGMIGLDSTQFDAARKMRDMAHRESIIRQIVNGALVEQSGYWIDEETGMLMKCRPDAYNPGLSLGCDLKSSQDAEAFMWSKIAGDYGYHMQEAIYSHGWVKASIAQGTPHAVDGFVFVVIESTWPHAVSIYELDPAAVKEGWEAYRLALKKWTECAEAEARIRAQHDEAEVPMHILADAWPGYPRGVQKLDIRPYHYKLTRAIEPVAT